MLWGTKFPYGNRSAPSEFLCFQCGDNGWGPMLRDLIWKELIPKRGRRNRHQLFMCQPCMEIKLQRPLTSTDLRDCPMNYRHELYRSHGHYYD